MEYKVPAQDWATKLADLIKSTKDGDVIIVASASAKELAERAKKRMCPTKNITFKIE